MKQSISIKGRKGQKGRSGKFDIATRRLIGRQYVMGDQSLLQLGQYYGVSKQVISLWAKLYGHDPEPDPEVGAPVNTSSMTEAEQDNRTLLEQQLAALKKKLEYEQMKNFALETIIELARTELGVDVRKNSGAKQPEE